MPLTAGMERHSAQHGFPDPRGDLVTAGCIVRILLKQHQYQLGTPPTHPKSELLLNRRRYMYLAATLRYLSDQHTTAYVRHAGHA